MQRLFLVISAPDYCPCKCPVSSFRFQAHVTLNLSPAVQSQHKVSTETASVGATLVDNGLCAVTT